MTASDSSELLDFLNLMLECERAGAKALRVLMDADNPPGVAEALPALFEDEARYCAGLTRHIRRLGGEASSKTGDFLQKVVATEGLVPRLDLLARGQQWVARRIAERLPAVADDELKAFLEEMHRTHDVNVAAARRLIEGLSAT